MPSQAERMAWMAEWIPQLPGSGIVYCLTVRDTLNVTNWLDSQGIKCEAYSGQVESDERIEIERKLLANEIKCVVATSALGMGYDKPDLGFVVHFQGPGSPIAYYQQVGRAGRGLEEADAVLLRGHRGPRRPGLLHQERLPAAGAGRAGDGAVRGSRPTAQHRRPDERDQPRQGPDGADAQAARGRGRPEQGQGRLGAQPARVGLRRGADPRRHRRQARRAEGDGGVRPRRPLPDGEPADRARRPRGRALRQVLDLHRAEVRTPRWTAAWRCRRSTCCGRDRSRSSRGGARRPRSADSRRSRASEQLEPGRALCAAERRRLGESSSSRASGRTSISATSWSRRPQPCSRTGDPIRSRHG